MRNGSEPRQYRILDVLGRGGFGTVYRAELQGAGGFVKEVALKVLNAEIEARPEHLARLRDEARVLGLVRHRALVGVDGLVKLLGRWTVVMELVDGVSLDALLRAHGPFPLPIALRIVEEVASGLYAAFTSTSTAAGSTDAAPLRLLHRDIKPSNIRITPHGDVKLLDFGVARAEFGAREAATSSLVFGSVPYLAPERLLLQDSHESDVYALAITFVQLATGVLPRQAAGDRALHDARVDEASRALARAGGPPALIALVGRTLAWDVAQRPDARDFERECRAVRTSLPDRHLADWADEHVRRVQARGAAEPGEFTGMIAVEAQTTENQRQLAELFGSRAPITFDDPVTFELSVPLPGADPISTTEATTPPDPVSPNPKAQETPRPALVAPAPRRRRWWLVMPLVAMLLAVLFAGVVALSAALGGTAVFGALVVAALSDPESACLSNLRVARQGLGEDDVRGTKKLAPLFERAQKGCRDGALGFWSSSLWTNELRKHTEDGVLSDTDLVEIDRALAELLAPTVTR